MSTEAIVAIIVGSAVSTALAVFGYLLKLQHNSSLERIKGVEDELKSHRAVDHVELSRTIGRLEAKVAKCEAKE